MFSATVRWGTTIECWNTVEMRLRHAPVFASAGAGPPSKRTSPVSGASSPDRIETSVDLPAPLRPTSPRQRPGWIAMSTPRSARVLPNCLLDADRLDGGLGLYAHALSSAIQRDGVEPAARAAVERAVRASESAKSPSRLHR